MAQKVTVTLVDDLDGDEAAETVLFGLDGISYEIDLGEDNAERLRDGLAEYVEAARRTRKSGRGGRGKKGAPAVDRNGGPAPVDREQAKAIRAWARTNGYEVSDRGRISASIVEAFQAAH